MHAIGWPGLTNGKPRTDHRRAIRFASDPATLADSASIKWPSAVITLYAAMRS